MTNDYVGRRSRVFRSVNGSPAENVEKVVEYAGGIQQIIGERDVLLIKPNGQWWNQGAPNLASMRRFVELVMDRPGGFLGEVVIAENCHRGPRPWESLGSAWKRPWIKNVDIVGVSNLGSLCVELKSKYGTRFSLVHWLDVAQGGRRVAGPAEGEGYVYCDGTRGVPLLACDGGVKNAQARSTIMTYPIFKTDNGSVVDFKNGIWDKGSYTGQPLRFINFAALNHHSTYCGMTSAVKNYLGITDLSGGPDPNSGGRLTEKYFNFHSFPFDKWAPGPQPGMLGKAVGRFMAKIRRADLNITTAEWVGLASRFDPPVARTRALLASRDPVALDYHAAKYLLYPNSGIAAHNPDRLKGALRHDLIACAHESAGVFGDEGVVVNSFDCGTKRAQGSTEMVLRGDIEWGGEVKPLLKYMYLRLFS